MFMHDWQPKTSCLQCMSTPKQSCHNSHLSHTQTTWRAQRIDMGGNNNGVNRQWASFQVSLISLQCCNIVKALNGACVMQHSRLQGMWGVCYHACRDMWYAECLTVHNPRAAHAGFANSDGGDACKQLLGGQPGHGSTACSSKLRLAVTG